MMHLLSRHSYSEEDLEQLLATYACHSRTSSVCLGPSKSRPPHVHSFSPEDGAFETMLLSERLQQSHSQSVVSVDPRRWSIQGAPKGNPSKFLQRKSQAQRTLSAYSQRHIPQRTNRRKASICTASTPSLHTSTKCPEKMLHSNSLPSSQQQPLAMTKSSSEQRKFFIPVTDSLVLERARIARQQSHTRSRRDGAGAANAKEGQKLKKSSSIQSLMSISSESSGNYTSFTFSWHHTLN